MLARLNSCHNDSQCLCLFIFIEPRPEDWMKDVDNRIQFGVDFGKNSGFLKSGDAVICITGWRKGAGSSNTIRILTIQ